MEALLCWNLLIFMAISICSLVNGAPSESECSDSNLRVTGGTLTLSEKYNDGSILRYQCPEGYYPYPVKKRICTNGKWDPVPRKKTVECKKITCPNPRVLENGEVEPFQVHYYVNDTTSYTCHSDYSLQGSSTRICQLNGKWNGSTPICSRNSDHCPDPGTPPGASRTGHIFNIDDKVTYRCDNKLKLLGSRERVCQDDGTWSGQEPECYADFTYDTPEEVAQAFGGTLKNTLTTFEDKGQAVKKIRLEQKGKLNIYIALDASDSINKDEFNEAKEIMIRLIERIKYYEVFPNYDILIFSTHVTKIVNITDNYVLNEEKNNIFETIQRLAAFEFEAKGEKSGTNIEKAYGHILESMSVIKAMNNTLFKETQHVIIMFTDGVANMGGNPTHKINEIKQTVYDGDELNREQYLDLYVFGVGENAHEVKENVNEWVTKRDKEKHFFLLKEMKDMQKILDEMIDESTSVGLCGLFKTYDEKSENYDHTAYPWMIKFSLSRDGKFSNCLGSLVNPTFILTAAHCFKFDDEPGSIHFQIPTNVKAKNVMLHPKYKITEKKTEGISEYYVYDVALIELKKPVKVDINLRPICIPCTKETSGALRLTGSGVTCQTHKEILLSNEFEDVYFMQAKTNRKNVYPKKKVQLKLKDQLDACIVDAGRVLNVSHETARKLITENFLCTGGQGSTDVDEPSCKGESGGATFLQQTYRAVQVGIVSWGLKDLCTGHVNLNMKEKNRDFHIDLFNPEVQKFLKEYLGDETRQYNEALHFL